MTELTPELRQRLAVEVMGWKLDQAGCYWFDGRVVSVMPTPLWDKHAWHPDQSIEQAMMLLSKIGKPWVMHYDCDDEKKYCCIILPDNEGCGDTPEMSASLAALAWLDRKEE